MVREQFTLPFQWAYLFLNWAHFIIHKKTKTLFYTFPGYRRFCHGLRFTCNQRFRYKIFTSKFPFHYFLCAHLKNIQKHFKTSIPIGKKETQCWFFFPIFFSIHCLSFFILRWFAPSFFATTKKEKVIVFFLFRMPSILLPIFYRKARNSFRNHMF